MNKAVSHIPKPSVVNANILQEITKPTETMLDVHLEQGSTEHESSNTKMADNASGKVQQMPADDPPASATPEAASDNNENEPPSKTGRNPSGPFSRSQGGSRRGRGWYRGRRGRGVRAVTPARHDEVKGM